MNPPTWFNSFDRLEMLGFAMLHWIGTPFLPNSCAVGRGVSCQKLAAAIYREAGFIDVDPPEVPMNHARFSRESLVVPWLATRPEFVRVPDEPGTEVLVGDLLGFKIGETVHHLGIVSGNSQFFHVIEGGTAGFASIADPTWGRRLAVIWRPVG